MKSRYYIPILISLLLLSCNTDKVTDRADYGAFLIEETNAEDLLANAQIWTDKLEAHPNQFPYLAKRAGIYTEIFDTTGDISYLIKAENDLLKAIEITNRKMPSFLKQLAANYISQHRFKEALDLLKEAEVNGEKLNGTKKMLFDVHLELGNDLAAESYLKQIKNTSDFDYLIRLAKWEDHNSNLEGAIEYMEKATLIAERSNIKSIKQWSYTNLADFYGHAGDIEKSYRHYLKALELDTNDAYAKKGIAWILYSHENNSEEALRILDHISSYYKSPDYELFKADIAEFQRDEKLKSDAISSYMKTSGEEGYGDIYNKYNVLVFTDELLLPKQALKIAQNEVQNRPTPQSYNLLAWSYFKLGNIEKANNIIEDYVDGQTSEPEVLYHIAEVYKTVGKIEKVKELKNELVGSLYELGPTMISKVERL